MKKGGIKFRCEFMAQIIAMIFPLLLLVSLPNFFIPLVAIIQSVALVPVLIPLSSTWYILSTGIFFSVFSCFKLS